MDANLSVSAINNTAGVRLPNIENQRPAVRQRQDNVNTDAAAAQTPPAQIAPSADTLNAHNAVSSAASEALITMDMPIPYGDSDITEATIARYIASVNESLAPSFFRLNFDIHEESERVMVTVIDINTDEVLREIPPESRLEMIARMKEHVGILYDGRV